MSACSRSSPATSNSTRRDWRSGLIRRPRAAHRDASGIDAGQRGDRGFVSLQHRVARRNGGIEVAKQSILQPIYPAMQGNVLPAFPCLSQDRSLAHIDDLLDDIELA